MDNVKRRLTNKSPNFAVLYIKLHSFTIGLLKGEFVYTLHEKFEGNMTAKITGYFDRGLRKDC